MPKGQKFGIEFKRKALARLSQETQEQVAQDLGVSVQSISRWKTAAGMGAKKAKRAAKKKAAAKRNGASNGHAPVTASPASLAQVESALDTALASVRAMRRAFEQVFRT